MLAPALFSSDLADTFSPRLRKRRSDNFLLQKSSLRRCTYRFSDDRWLSLFRFFNSLIFRQLPRLFILFRYRNLTVYFVPPSLLIGKTYLTHVNGFDLNNVIS